MHQPVEVTPLEHERIERVLSMLPRDATNVLEIGSRYGVMTRRLAEIFDDVTALDLQKPPFQIDHVTPAQGDVQNLDFPDNSFDCVICTEVLEHVPGYLAGAREITRVARLHILIGVPYRQDTRVGRTTCPKCRKISPPYGHVNSFDESKIRNIFRGAEICTIEYLAKTRERTNFLSTWLQDLAGNPYGTYYDDGNCVHCGAELIPPARASFLRRAAGAAGFRLQTLQSACSRSRPIWMLVLFEKNHFRDHL